MAQQDIQSQGVGADVTTSSELDYKPKIIEHSTYRYNRLVPITNGQQVILSAASTTETTFEIPTKVLNFARTRLEFTMHVAAAAANQANIFHAVGFPMIDRLSLYTRNGVFLVDVNSFNTVYNMILPYTTSEKELLEKPVCEPIAGAIGAPSNSLSTGIQVSNANGTANTQQLDNAGVRGNWYVVNDTHGFCGSREIRYLMNNSGGADPGTAVANLVQYRVDFGDLAHTLFAMDKSLYFGEILVLRVQWAPTTKVGARFVAAGHPGAANNVVIPTAVTLFGLQVQLAVEANLQVAQSVIAHTAQNGMRLLVPYIYTNKYSHGGGGFLSVQQRLNRGHGRSLLKVYHALFANNEAGLTAFQHSNLGGAFINSFYSSLDNDRLQELNIDCTDDQDWKYLRELSKGSTIRDIREYYFNWVWIDDWTGKPTIDWRMTDSADCGLPLANERLWSIQEQLNNAPYQAYTIYVTQKVLTITPSQITLV